MNSVNVFIKKVSVGSWGQEPEKRSVKELIFNGMINLDKPKGPTSHQVSDYVQKILGVEKAGHSGTLDPQVTGVQPLGLGKSTRITEFLLTAPKEYVGIMHLHQNIEKEKLNVAFKKFIGKIQQLPPIKSAVKRELRTREIYEFEILEIKEKEVLFRVKCQAGTYIRKLCHDLGQALGIGAHMTELRRIRAGPFGEEDSLVTLQDLQDAFYIYEKEGKEKFLRYCLQPVETALKYISKCWALDTALLSISHGRDLSIPGVAKLENFRKGEVVAVMSLKGELIAMGEAMISAVEINTQTKGIAIKVKKVFKEVEF